MRQINFNSVVQKTSKKYHNTLCICVDCREYRNYCSFLMYVHPNGADECLDLSQMTHRVHMPVGTSDIYCILYAETFMSKLYCILFAFCNSKMNRIHFGILRILAYISTDISYKKLVILLMHKSFKTIIPSLDASLHYNDSFEISGF